MIVHEPSTKSYSLAHAVESKDSRALHQKTEAKPTYLKGTTVDNGETTESLDVLTSHKLEENHSVKKPSTLVDNESYGLKTKSKVSLVEDQRVDPKNFDEGSLETPSAPSYMTLGEPVVKETLIPVGENEKIQDKTSNILDVEDLENVEIPETIQTPPEITLLKTRLSTEFCRTFNCYLRPTDN